MEPQLSTPAPRRTPPAPADDDTMLSAPRTQEFVGGITRMCLWRWQRDPRVNFPAPTVINSRNYWRLGDLRAWQAEMVRRGTASANKAA